MKNETSAGILVYRIVDGNIEVLLGKNGGPKYEHMNVGAWNIPKGHVEDGENFTTAALREFNEETSLDLMLERCDELIDLGETKTKAGKTVKIFAIERDFVPGEYKVDIKSNMCTTEWPPKSGNIIKVPELSDAFYFKMNVAMKLIFSYQKYFLNKLSEILNNKSGDISEQIEGCAVAPIDAGSATAGMTTTDVFGPAGASTDSIVEPKPKEDGQPGLTTSDMHEIYVPRGKFKDYPLFRRGFGRKRKPKK